MEHASIFKPLARASTERACDRIGKESAFEFSAKKIYEDLPDVINGKAVKDYSVRVFGSFQNDELLSAKQRREQRHAAKIPLTRK